MKPIIKYEIVNASDISKLQEEVNRYIEKGWIPQGGVYVIGNDAGYPFWYIQAMVKK